MRWVFLLLVLTSCGCFAAGDRVKAWIQLDPSNKCRILITGDPDDGKNIPRSAAAILENCKP